MTEIRLTAGTIDYRDTGSPSKRATRASVVSGFRADGVENGPIVGTLTIRDVIRPVTLRSSNAPHRRGR
jgi:hypothetical protein